MGEEIIHDPETEDEWQEAVDAAWFMLSLQSARLYGLLEGGPEVDVTRCDYIIREAQKLGIAPRLTGESEVT